MSTDQPAIQFGHASGGLYIDVMARATQRVAPTVLRVVEDYLSVGEGQPACTIDLAGADWVDSTFAGCLVALHKRLAARSGTLRLNHCNEACLKSLSKMYLDTLAVRVDETTPGGLQTLVCATSDRPSDEEIRLMIAAHQELANINEQNDRIFTPVVEMLKKQLPDSA